MEKKSKKRIRELILYEYRLGHTAMEATNNLCLADGEHAVNKATDECGAIFTMKLKGMFKDMGTSADLMEEYKNTPQFSSSNVEFSVEVLTAVNWPYHATTSINIPLNVLSAFETFKDYYLGKHSGRKLDLLVNQGYAELNAYFYGSNNMIKL